MRRSLCAAVSIAVVAAALAACGGGSGSRDKGTTLVIDTAFQLATLDPARMFEPTGTIVDRALYDTLLKFEGGDVEKPVADLAESYTSSPDGKVFTFVLRKGAVFSDGTPITSADVAFSLNRVINIKGNPSFLLDGVSVSTPDESTVVLTSQAPNPAIPFILPNPALGIINSKAVQAAGGSADTDAATADTAESSLNATSQGSGPYILESYSKTTQVVLSANPRYWGPKPSYDKIIIRNVQANVQKLDVQKGAAQIALDMSPAQAQGLSGLQQINSASPNVFFLFANESTDISGVTANPKFQEAVRYGIDYAGLLQLAGEGAEQAPGVIPTNFVGSLPASDAVTRDVPRAKAALAASGVGDATVTLGYPTDLQVNGLNFGDLAARVQQNLEEVGIHVKLSGASVETATEAYRAGKLQLGLWYWGPDFPDPSDYLAFLPGQLVGLRASWDKGADPVLEKLGAQASSTIDLKVRESLYQDIQRRMNTSGPFMPLLQPAAVLVAATSVGNLKADPLTILNINELQ